MFHVEHTWRVSLWNCQGQHESKSRLRLGSCFNRFILTKSAVNEFFDRNPLAYQVYRKCVQRAAATPTPDERISARTPKNVRKPRFFVGGDDDSLRVVKYDLRCACEFRTHPRGCHLPRALVHQPVTE
jgi:hypothetical protein